MAKKEFKPIKFTVDIDDKKTEFEIIKPTVIVPGYGKFTADQLAKKDQRSQEALALLVERNSGVIREVTKEKTTKKGGE